MWDLLKIEKVRHTNFFNEVKKLIIFGAPLSVGSTLPPLKHFKSCYDYFLEGLFFCHFGAKIMNLALTGADIWRFVFDLKVFLKFLKRNPPFFSETVSPRQKSW